MPRWKRPDASCRAGAPADSLRVYPGINYSTQLKSTPASLAARRERDFDARNTFNGDVVLASATFAF